jgi:hypothetical protein
MLLSYNLATATMYVLSTMHNHTQYQHYTGWSRLQSIFCIPFLYHPQASDLIRINSFGCFISVHIFYSLSRYEILHTLASRSLQPFALYRSCKYKRLVHFIADFIVHGTPCVLSMALPNEPYAYKKIHVDFAGRDPCFLSVSVNWII